MTGHRGVQFFCDVAAHDRLIVQLNQLLTIIAETEGFADYVTRPLFMEIRCKGQITAKVLDVFLKTRTETSKKNSYTDAFLKYSHVQDILPAEVS